MKTLFYILFLLISVCSNANEIKLTYEPKGLIVCFDFDSLKIYSDTTSVLELVNNYKDPIFKARARLYVLRQINEQKSDTIIFNKTFVEFNDNEMNSHTKGWYIETVPINLTKINKVKIIEKTGRVIKFIAIKKNGSKKKGHIKRSFYDVETKKELFYQTIFIRTDIGDW